MKLVVMMDDGLEITVPVPDTTTPDKLAAKIKVLGVSRIHPKNKRTEYFPVHRIQMIYTDGIQVV